MKITSEVKTQMELIDSAIDAVSDINHLIWCSADEMRRNAEKLAVANAAASAIDSDSVVSRVASIISKKIKEIDLEVGELGERFYKESYDARSKITEFVTKNPDLDWWGSDRLARINSADERNSLIFYKAFS